MRRNYCLIVTCVGCMAAALVAGCEQKPVPAPAKPVAPAAQSLPAGLIVTTAPTDDRTVLDVKKSAAKGDSVVVRGKIGGRDEPFVEGRAIFLIVDTSVPSCADHGGEDHCKTPWDYCCEPADRLSATSLTVRFVGADGAPLKMNVNGQSGIKPLAEIVVKGKVSDKSGEAMVIDAEQVYVKS